MVLVALCFVRKHHIPNPLVFFEGFFEIFEIVSKNRARVVAMAF